MHFIWVYRNIEYYTPLIPALVTEIQPAQVLGLKELCSRADARRLDPCDKHRDEENMLATPVPTLAHQSYLKKHNGIKIPLQLKCTRFQSAQRNDNDGNRCARLREGF